MNIALIGSHNFQRLDKVVEFIIRLPKDSLIITADIKRGVEYQAIYTCDVLGIETKLHRPIPALHGKNANKFTGLNISEHCDFLVVFWSGLESDYLDFHSAYEYCSERHMPIIWIFE